MTHEELRAELGAKIEDIIDDIHSSTASRARKAISIIVEACAEAAVIVVSDDDDTWPCSCADLIRKLGGAS